MLFIDITVALLAAWGLFCIMKLCYEMWFISDRSRALPAFRLSGNETDDEIVKLYESIGNIWFVPRSEIIFIIPENGDGGRRAEEKIKALGFTDVSLFRE